ncbi:ATP-binding cassette domain-containing protein [Nocardia sp. CDC159]|uniref:ATP-binding cassette domain-containing protein n=2 Tax=Nocardiaceae TaxID=85025 RepID=A0A9X2E6G6_9NOCA|nr:ATP-binding cassette domain-containing protein [Nocardia pulmonis]MCM6787404.1 ATP-binding cassette domain-containing protein [Nocardia sp. CDC159]
MAAITGPSGSGKSTLLNCLGLLEPPTSGRIVYERTDLTALNRRKARHYRRNSLGYLFQHYALIENATVADNLELAFTKRATRATRRIRCHRALEQVGLAGRENTTIHQLSGGEQQRVALAQLLIKQPPVILADEPTAALDIANIDIVINILRELTTTGATVIVVTHNDDLRTRADVTHTLGN